MGEYGIGGFDAVNLAATDTLSAMNPPIQGTDAPQTGRLTVDGSLNLRAGAITGEDNAQLAIAAQGAVRIDSSGSAPTPDAMTGLGARLNIEGASIVNAGRIEMRSGSVELRATGSAPTDNVTVASGATINVAGSTEHFADQEAYTPAGDIKLVSDHGAVELQQGSTLDLSGSGAGDAGRLEFDAIEGTASSPAQSVRKPRRLRLAGPSRST